MRLTASVILAGVLALSVGVLGGCVHASTRSTGQTSQTDLSNLNPNPEPVTLRFQNAPLVNVISFLGQASGIQIRVAPDVTLPQEPVNINFNNAKFVDVFNFLMNAGKLSYRVVDPKTVLITKKA